MRRAITTTEKNLFRTRPQRTKLYVAIHRPASLYSAPIAGVPSTYPVSALALSTASQIGTATLCSPGMTVFVGDAQGGSTIGKLRLRKAFSGSVIPVAEAGSGVMRFKAGDWVTVMKEFRPWVKHPRYDTAASRWLMDYDIAYASQLEYYGPVIRMGPPVAGFLTTGSAGEPWLSTSFVGTSTVSPGASITAGSWIFPNNIVHAGIGTEDTPVTYSFSTASPGGDYFEFRAWDSNGASYLGRRLVFTFRRDTYDPPRVEFMELTGDPQAGGYRATIRFVGKVDDDSVPEGTEIVVFESASYGSTPQSIGGNYPFRENIIFRGWTVGETATINPFHGDATIIAESINGIMNRAASYDVFHQNVNPPNSSAVADQWIHAASLSIDTVAIDLLKYRSTVGEVTDFTLGSSSGGLFRTLIDYQDLPLGYWWDQMVLNYGEKGALGKVSSDMQGNLYAYEDVLVTGTSNNIPITYNVATKDIRDTVIIEKDYRDTNAQTRILGIKRAEGSGDPTPLGGESPGQIMGWFGDRYEKSSGLFTEDQQTMITWAGNVRAKANNPFKNVTVPLAGNLKIDPVPQSRVKLNLAASHAGNARKYIWNEKQFLPTGLAMTYDSQTGTLLTQLSVESIVDGAGGSAITFPNPGPITTPEPPTPPSPPGDPPPTAGGGQGTVYVTTQFKIGKTTDLSASSPAYTDITPAGVTTVYDFILDPWAPATTGYLATDVGLYKSTNLNSASPSWTLKLSVSAIASHFGTTSADVQPMWKVVGSINQQHYVATMVAVSTPSTFLYCIYSEDGGNTWSYSSSVSGTTTVGGRYRGGFEIVPHTINNSLTLFAINHFTGGNFRLYRSSNKGATWTLSIGSPPLPDPDSDTYYGLTLHSPYNGNAGGSILYMGWWGIGNVGYFVKTEDLSTISNVNGTLKTSAKRTGVETYTDNKNLVYHWGAGSGGDLSLSTDGGSSFSRVASADVTGVPYATGGFPTNNQQYYVVTDSGIYISLNNGASFINKTGDFETNVGSLSSLAIGYGTIVPNWLE